MSNKFIKTAALMLAVGALTAFTSMNEIQKGKWENLFDGKTTKGWHTYLKQDVSPQWKAENGELSLTAKGGGDIVTDKEYENFELELEWKIAEGGNSGIFYRA